MTSGLAFSEDYEAADTSDVEKMLYLKGDMSAYAAEKPLEHTPGTYWSYSSGTTNIIARVLRQSFADEQEYLRFPRERLFEPIGCIAPFWSRMPRAYSLAHPIFTPRRAIGRGSAFCICAMAYGRADVCCRKIGSQTA